MKKILAIFLSVVIIGANIIAPVSNNYFATKAIVSAAEVTSGDYIYTIKDDGTGIEITKYIGSGGSALSSNKLENSRI